jgi:hypothetical protein
MPGLGPAFFLMASHPLNILRKLLDFLTTMVLLKISVLDKP